MPTNSNRGTRAQHRDEDRQSHKDVQAHEIDSDTRPGSGVTHRTGQRNASPPNTCE